MSYEKTSTGDRCLLQVDGPKVVSTSDYEEIGMGNPRLHSAIQILKDLDLIEDDDNGVTYLTTEGKQFIKQELAKEDENEVS
jgi:predicted transcriptional regulator